MKIALINSSMGYPALKSAVSELAEQLNLVSLQFSSHT